LVTPKSQIKGVNYNSNGHFGLGFGLEYSHLNEPGQYLENNNGSIMAKDSFIMAVGGYGLNLEMTYYPVLNDHVNIGIMPSYAIGGLLGGLSSSDYYDESSEEYFYQRFQLESEIALGLESIKFLFKYHLSSQLNDYKKVDKTSYYDDSQTYIYDGNINRESLYFGLRLGSLKSYGNYRSDNTFDILYSLSKKRPDNLFDDVINNSGLSSWQVGAGFSWWSQIDLKLQFDVVLNSKQTDFSMSGDDFQNALYRISIIYNNR